MSADSERWRVRPGADVDLTAIDPTGKTGAPGDREATEATYPALHEEFAGLQERLYAEDERSLLVVLQAMDAGGKDGTIKHLFAGANPQGLRVTPFKAPTETELAHDFLWRVHQAAPAKGEIAVFNRSHYEDVVAVRVRALAPESVWRTRFDHIKTFEDHLVAAGTTIVKLFLHISREEQAERMRARLERPDKHWKFRRGDLDDRARWDDFMVAYAEALGRTSTERAPWYVVPADRKWFRNWAVSRIVLEALAAMGPEYPEPEPGLDSVVVT